MLSHSMPGLGRVRGALLRMVRRRWLSILLGLLLAAPGAWIEIAALRVPSWVEALSVVAGASGFALLWAGLRGPRPDWIDD